MKGTKAQKSERPTLKNVVTTYQKYSRGELTLKEVRGLVHKPSGSLKPRAK